MAAKFDFTGNYVRPQTLFVDASAISEQSDIKLNGAKSAVNSDSLVVSVDSRALLASEIHSGEAVDLVADPSVVS